MTHYPPILIVLHWLLALFILVALFMGQDIANLSNDLDLKVDRLKVHAIAGVLIGLAFIGRLAVRVRQQKHHREKTNETANQRLAKIYHTFLYSLVLAVVFSGIAVAAETDFLKIAISGDTLPNNLVNLASRKAHGFLTKLLSIAIALHVIAALYHQWILKDKLFSKMWFRKPHLSKPKQ